MEKLTKGLVTIEEANKQFAASSEEAKVLQEALDKTMALIFALVEEREKQGYTQRDLALKLDWKQPALARFERLEAIPRLDTFLKVTHSLGGNVFIEFFEGNTIPLECLQSSQYIASLTDTEGYSTDNYLSFVPSSQRKDEQHA